jgi:hypothetical protein
MKLEVITETLSSEEVALRQLEQAISLFLDERDFVSALTLAGAAEEILGNLLKRADMPHALEEIIEGSLKIIGIEPGAKEAKRQRMRGLKSPK